MALNMNAPSTGTPPPTSDTYEPRSASSSTFSPVTVPSFSAARVSFCHWSRPWWAAISDSERVSVYFTGRPRRRASAIAIHSSGVGLQLAAEATAHVGRDHAQLRLRDAHRRGEREPQDVRDLGGGPHGDLLAGGVDHHGAGLHERRDQPLLAVLPLDHDAAVARLADRVLDVAAGAGLAGVEHPERRLVGAEVGVREHLVLRGLLEVDRGGELVVVDVHELGGVARLGGGAGHDHGHDLAGERDPVDRDRGVHGSLLLRRDRPGVDQDALHVRDVGRR